MNDLSPENRKKVVCFGDVDENKVFLWNEGHEL